MKCLQCESPAVDGSELGLCAACDANFRKEAGEAAGALERDEPGSRVRATKIIAKQVELLTRAMFEPLREPLQSYLQPKPEPKPALSVLEGATNEGGSK